MSNSYKVLREKLLSETHKTVTPVNNLNELQNKYEELSKKFTIPSSKKEIKKILEDKLVNKYEETKSNITIATFIEKLEQKYSVSMIIFDNDYTYSNLLRKQYNSLDQAQEYFYILKNKIKDCDLDTLSNYILNNL